MELNSETAPTTARIYQLKKKDVGEWGWKELTALDGPAVLKADGTPKKKRVPKDASKVLSFTDSPIGKLALSAHALTGLTVSAHFVSNAGCSVPLASPPGMTASSAQECSLDQIDHQHAANLRSAILAISDGDLAAIALSDIHLEKTVVHPDNPEDAIVGRVSDLLSARSPSHAAQARTLVRGLFVTISTRGRHTGLCIDMPSLRKRRGFGRSDMLAALADLQKVPDFESIRAAWLTRLESDMDLFEHTGLSVALARPQVDRLQGNSDPFSQRPKIRAWVEENPPTQDLFAFLQAGKKALMQSYPELSKVELYAYLLNEGVRSCVDQISAASSGV